MGRVVSPVTQSDETPGMICNPSIETGIQHIWMLRALAAFTLWSFKHAETMSNYTRLVWFVSNMGNVSVFPWVPHFTEGLLTSQKMCQLLEACIS